MPQYQQIPQPNDNRNQSQVDILNNFTYLQTTLGGVNGGAANTGGDHVFANDTATAQNGYHKVIHFKNQAADPAAIAGVGQLYTKTIGADQLLVYESGGGAITPMTGPNNPLLAGNGYVWWPGLVLYQWGTKNAPGSSGTVNFATSNVNFPGNCWIVVATPKRTGSPSNVDVIYIQSKSNTGFTYACTSGSFNSFDWIAIGN